MICCVWLCVCKTQIRQNKILDLKINFIFYKQLTTVYKTVACKIYDPQFTVISYVIKRKFNTIHHRKESEQ